MNISIHRDGQEYGPYTLEQVQMYVADGTLIPSTDLAWYEGMSEWIPLKDALQQQVPQTVATSTAHQPSLVQAADVPLRTDSIAAKATVSATTFWITFFLCVLLGLFGAHRFYLGKKSAWLMLLTFGGCGLWWIVDILLLLSNQLTDTKKNPVINPKPIVTWPMAAVWLLIFLLNTHDKSNHSPTSKELTTTIDSKSNETNNPTSVHTSTFPQPSGILLPGIYITTNDNNEIVRIQISKDKTYWLNNNLKHINERGTWNIDGDLVNLLGPDGTVMMNLLVNDDNPPSLVFGPLIFKKSLVETASDTSSIPTDDEIALNGAKFVNDRIEKTIGPVSQIKLIAHWGNSPDYTYGVAAHNTTHDIDTVITVIITGSENNWSVTSVESTF